MYIKSVMKPNSIKYTERQKKVLFKNNQTKKFWLVLPFENRNTQTNKSATLKA